MRYRDMNKVVSERNPILGYYGNFAGGDLVTLLPTQDLILRQKFGEILARKQEDGLHPTSECVFTVCQGNVKVVQESYCPMKQINYVIIVELRSTTQTVDFTNQDCQLESLETEIQ